MNEINEKYYIYGKNPVQEVLINTPNRLNKIYIQKNFSFDNRIKNILDLANEKKIVVQFTNLSKFNEYFEEKVNFQGVVASISPVEFISLDEFINRKKEGYKRLVILDGVSDPHNLGSIIRTSAAVGIDAILISNHRSCPVSATVEKISSGAINHVSIIKTTSLASSIDYLKKHDFWIIATQMQARQNYYEVDYTDMNFALVMGSEGSGISKTILNKADFTVKMESNFESLNVGVATGIILYEAKRQLNIKTSKSINK